LIKPFWKQYYFQLKAHENGGRDPEVRSQQAYETVATVQCQGMKKKVLAPTSITFSLK
jgi:hypothetical protein